MFISIQIGIVSRANRADRPPRTTQEKNNVSCFYPQCRGKSEPRARAVFLDLVDRYGQTVTTAGLYASLAVIYFWFGGMKFTAYEAEGLTGLVGNSPLLSWTYSLFSVRDFLRPARCP